MIFGLRRSQPKQTIDWSSVMSLLEDDDRRAVIERLYPSEGRDSFLSALRRLDATSSADLLSAGRRLQTAEKLVDWPTVAVAGMLNSGKTSLVATFLSEQGRSRTLRGANNDQGTHRFVLWLPTTWQSDAELWGLLMSRIGDAIGRPPEMLSEDPAAAHRQYNNRDGTDQLLSVPLVATDSALDATGLGLLDCPDIVSDEALGLGSPEVRRDLLRKAATLCSAFLVVSAAESSRDATLGELMRIASDLMPGIPRMLAVNKIRPGQTPDQVYETFGPLVRAHGVDTVFAAYDYEVPASRPFIPVAEDSPTVAMNRESEPLPVFFSLAEDADDNPPAAISDDRMLSALPQKLDRGQLFEKFRIALEAGLRSRIWDQGFSRIDRDADESIAATDKAQHCLLQASLEFFAHRAVGGEVSELRLHQSERIIRQLSESFALTAPWYARWGVRLNAKVRRVFGGASDFVRQLAPSALAQKTAGEIKDKFSKGEYGGLVTPGRLTAAIQRHGGSTLLPHWPAQSGDAAAGSRTRRGGESGQAGEADNSQWNEAAEAAITRFERDDFTSLDPRRLDEAVRQMWSEVPTHKKLAAGLTPLAAMFAVFAGVLTIPIDFGGTALMLQASIPELFAAAGFTTLAAVWSGGHSTRSVGQQAAGQQLADFHAVLCDTFGVARVSLPCSIRVGGSGVTLPLSQIVTREAVGPTLPVYRVRDEFRQELQRLVPRSGS
jgi:hypothetical protein